MRPRQDHHHPAAVAVRAVRATRRNRSGEIAAPFNDDEWSSPRDTAAVIRDIETGVRTYYVRWPDGYTKICVTDGPDGKHLRTDHDATTRNNLLDLPDC